VTEPNRRGRPPLENARSTPVNVRMTARDYDAAYARAQRDRVSVPEVLRRAMRAAAKEEKEQ
jgi:hypothetical protein